MALMEHGSTSSPQAASESGLRRELGLFDATMLIMGDMIGIGIFVTTGDIDYHDGERFPSLIRVDGTPDYLDDITKPLTTPEKPPAEKKDTVD